MARVRVSGLHVSKSSGRRCIRVTYADGKDEVLVITRAWTELDPVPQEVLEDPYIEVEATKETEPSKRSGPPERMPTVVHTAADPGAAAWPVLQPLDEDEPRRGPREPVRANNPDPGPQPAQEMGTGEADPERLPPELIHTEEVPLDEPPRAVRRKVEGLDNNTARKVAKSLDVRGDGKLVDVKARILDALKGHALKDAFALIEAGQV